MKNTNYFHLFLWLLSLTALPSALFAQNDTKYPIEISDINLPTEYWEPQILLSAIVMDHDYYIITMRVENNANFRKVMTVRPFTIENFKRVLRTGRNDLIARSNLQNEEKNIAKKEDIPSKNIPPEDAIRDSLSNPVSRFESGLFYQLKGSEIATPVGLGRPVAGSLCFSSRFTVKKKLNSYNVEQLHEETEKYIKNEWIDYLKRTNQDTTKKISKSTHKSIRVKYDLDKVRKNDALFEKNRKEIISTSKFMKEMEPDEVLKRREKLDKEFDQRRNAFKNDDYFSKEIRGKFLDNINRLHLKFKENKQDKYLTYWEYKLYIRNDTIFRQLDSLYNYYKNNQIKNSFSSLYNLVVDSGNLMSEEQLIEKLQKEIDNKYKEILPSLSLKTSFDFNITYVEIEFNEGFIENILVVGEVKTLNFERFYDERLLLDVIDTEDVDATLGEFGMLKKQIKFENRYPLGFSRKSDYESLGIVEITSNGKNEEDRYMLALNDLLTIYLPKHEIGRRDFSPENRIIRYDPLQGDDCITLYKEETSKLFEARVFSDFVGLDGKEPNGLLQTEISKRLNLITSRPFGKGISFWSNLGIFSWLEPTVTLSKIENNNKILLLDKIVPNDTFGRARYYATTLDVRRHESLSVGARLNMFYYDLPSLKSTLSANGSIYYGRTPIQIDSNETGINTFTFCPELICDIRADERWGLSLSYRWNFMKTMSREIVQISDLLDVNNELVEGIKNKQYNTAQFQVFFQPSEDNRGRLFFRYRYHWQYGDQNLGFHQAQVGYSFYLLGRNKGKEIK